MAYSLDLKNTEDFNSLVKVRPLYTSGIPIGIIAVNLIYPKLPGNVANASTFRFPVLYEIVDFEIEELFRGDEKIKQQIIEAARKLEAQGVRAIVGACGFFAHFQKDVREAVNVPVFMSSLCQIPIISTGLKEGKKIAVIAADGKSITNRLLEKVGATNSRLVVFNVGDWESFSPIRYGKTELDNGALTRDLENLAKDIAENHREIGAILLECSDLPPYAYNIQRVSGLPVYDFISLINWVEHSVEQRPYYGII